MLDSHNKIEKNISQKRNVISILISLVRAFLGTICLSADRSAVVTSKRSLIEALNGNYVLLFVFLYFLL